jgi:hypothetical protein
MNSESIELRNNSAEDGNLLLGGFFLTRPLVEPRLNRIPPGGLLTVSKCLADFVPDDWIYWNRNIRMTERAERAMAVGIKLSSLDGLTAWCNEEFSAKHTLGYPNVIFDIVTARRLVKEIPECASVLCLLGIGLPFEVSGKFFQAAQWDARRATRPPLGIPAVLEKGLILPGEGEFLGFDALGYEFEGTFHSSKCFATHDSRVQSIRLNDFGYCTNVLDATLLCEIHSKTSDKGIVWLPWVIRKFPLE